MKKAIGYIRVSTKDQSNFSPDAQEKYIRDYAEQKGIEMLSVFVDNGRSAKNFDRPNWNLLEEFVKKHFRTIDYLIVVKYDRFSRKASDGLYKIEMLEKRFQIIIMSVFEQMYIDYEDPYFFKQRADMLVAAEYEWHVIRDRTRFCIHHALSQGRFVSKAPFGYKNVKEEKTTKIVVDEAKAVIVQKIFEDFISGVPFIEIYHRAKKNGLTLRSRTVIWNILKNPVYAGLVNVPAYRKEPTKIVKGIHQGIISEATWWDCQSRLGIVKNRTRLNNTVPFRGLLLCPHGFPLTAGESQGRRDRYWYYRSTHCGMNVSAKKVHNQFDEILKHLSLPGEYVTILTEQVTIEMEKAMKDRSANLRQRKQEIDKLSENLTRLEEKFIMEQITVETYSKWYNTYSQQLESLRSQVTMLEDGQAKYWNLFKKQLPKLSDLHYLFHKMELVEKRSFIKEGFKSSLAYYADHFRTAYLINILRHNELILTKKRLLFIDNNATKSDRFAECARDWI